MSRKKGNGGLPWWGFLLGFIIITNFEFTFPLIPIAVFFLIFRAVKVNSGSRNISSDSRQDARMEKYLIMTEERNVESIEYLASAVGVSYDTVLRDLQKMVAEGRFGPDAYINYVDRTVVIHPSAQRPAGDREKARRTSAGSQEAKSKAEPRGVEKKSGDTDDRVRTILLIAGIVLIGIGILRLALGGDSLFGLISGVITALGGAGLFGFRGYLKKRENRFKLYKAACAGRDCVAIEELAKKAGISTGKCRRDLDAMIEKGLLTKTAYIDQGDGMLVLKPGAAPKAESEPEPPADDEDRYKAIIRQIRKLNDEIPDEDVSRRIDEMEDLTRRIFQAVREKPEKEPQIKSFMSYYLPTTLKLLRSYADFEKSGADGDNIRSTKAQIERILDTLVDGFKKQLDKLYEAEAMDISSDIDVLETMLRRDGLTGDGSAFQAQKKP